MKIHTSKIMSGDITLPYLGEAMLVAPVILRDIISSQYGEEVPVLKALLELGLSQQEEEINGHQLRWSVYGSSYPPTTIVSVSNATPRVKETFQITLRNPWFKNGAHLRLGQRNQTIVLTNDGFSAPGNTKTYNAQYISVDPAATAPSGLLVANARVDLLAGIYGEFSERGHPINFSSPDMYINNTTLIRTDAGISGHAMVNNVVDTLIYENTFYDGLTGEAYPYAGALPMFYKGNTPLILAHALRIEKELIYGVGNVNPLTGEIMNTDQRDEPLPIGDGFIRMLDGLAMTSTYSINEAASSFAAKLEAMLVRVGQFTGVAEPLIYVMGGKLGRQKLIEATNYLDARAGVVRQRQVNGSDTVQGGIKAGDFVTDNGTIKFLWNKHADSYSSPYARVNLKGSPYPLESGDLYFIFANQQGRKPNIRVYSAGGTFQGKKISRSFVLKHLPGVTGWGSAFQSSFSRAMNMTADMAVTGRDGEQFMALSEKMLIVDNPAQFGMMIATP